MPINLLQVPEKDTVVAFEMSFYDITSVDIDLCLDCSLQIVSVIFFQKIVAGDTKIFGSVHGTA